VLDYIIPAYIILVIGKYQPITDNEGPEVQQRYSATLSLTSALDGVGGQRRNPAAFPPRKTRYQLYRRLVGPKAGLDGCGISPPPPAGIRPPDRPVRSESLYRLSYPGPHLRN
jgi:hypothetical protein